jgi:excisionase family DNA binding protein
MNDLNSSIPDLLIRPYPATTEGPTGYIFRLAEVNFMRPRDLIEMGITLQPQVLSLHHLLPKEALFPELHAHVARMHRLQSEQSAIWNKRYARFCPLCLIAEPVWQASWELFFFDACPHHGGWLIDQCSTCGEHLDWHRDSLVRCQCGSDLREEKPEEAPWYVKRLSIVMESILLNKPQPDYPCSYPFVGLEPVELQTLIRYLGAYLDLQAGPKPLKIRCSGLLENSWAITSLASQVLFEWPSGFDQALTLLLEDANSETVTLSSVFDQAYNYIYTGGLRSSSFIAVRDAFEAWLVEHWPNGANHRNRRLAESLLAEVEWIPAKQAEDQLGISRAQLSFLIQHGELEGHEIVTASGRRRMTVRKDQLAQLEEKLAGEITMTKAMEILGLNKARLQRIVKLLFPSSRRVNDQQLLPWCIPRFEVYGVVALGEEKDHVQVIEDCHITLRDVLQYWQWSGDEIVSLIEAIRSGEIQILSIWDGASGISRWVFDRATLKRWRASLENGRANWITIPELAEVLGVKQQVAYWLTQNNFIPSVKLGTLLHIGSRVKKKDVDRFLQTHLFGTEIADRIGRSPRKTMYMLRDTNIYPLRGESTEACRQAVYTKSDALIRFLERYSVVSEEVAAKLRATSQRRKNAWDRIIYENGTDQPDDSHFCLDSP